MANDKERIYLSPPHMSGKEMMYIKEAFDTNWIAPLGPNIDGFEEEISSYVGVNGAVAVSSGTAAIHLALRLIGVGEGDKVFCSAFTFVATANPIMYQGAEPVFIDSEPDTWNMSPQALKTALEEADQEGKLPKAVIVVHLYGQSARMEEIVALCKLFEVPLIEDAAESLGSTYGGIATGTIGDFGIYSFNGNKIITTSGGGMMVSNNPDALIKARFLASQARDPASHYQHSTMGYNYRMSNVLAGIGRGQLQVLDERVKKRRLIFENYLQALADIQGVQFMPELPGTFSNRWLTALTIDEKITGVSVHDVLYSLSEENIEARPLWKPMHIQPLFAGAKYYPHASNVSVCEQLFQTGICLPSGSKMTEEQQTRVIGVIRNCIRASSHTGEGFPHAG